MNGPFNTHVPKTLTPSQQARVVYLRLAYSDGKASELERDELRKFEPFRMLQSGTDASSRRFYVVHYLHSKMIRCTSRTHALETAQLLNEIMHETKTL